MILKPILVRVQLLATDVGASELLSVGIGRLPASAKGLLANASSPCRRTSFPLARLALWWRRSVKRCPRRIVFLKVNAHTIGSIVGFHYIFILPFSILVLFGKGTASIGVQCCH
jgi:hypothetical protein